LETERADGTILKGVGSLIYLNTSAYPNSSSTPLLLHFISKTLVIYSTTSLLLQILVNIPVPSILANHFLTPSILFISLMTTQASSTSPPPESPSDKLYTTHTTSQPNKKQCHMPTRLPDRQRGTHVILPPSTRNSRILRLRGFACISFPFEISSTAASDRSRWPDLDAGYCCFPYTYGVLCTAASLCWYRGRVRCYCFRNAGTSP
jgi:hypothetical protein